ncbi:hypothetical protein ART_3438 [Arthrobacter sp. PAMC 25486]|nr:hypothetical protein ART_3438 [Arthrobacter sp. PAMC 25486]
MELNHRLAEFASCQSDAGPENWATTYRQMALYDLAADVELGFFLAYYRNLTIPGIATSLHENGEIVERPMKRSYDTAIVTYELITNGLNSDRHVIRLLNHAHRHVPGNPDDFLHVPPHPARRPHPLGPHTCMAGADAGGGNRSNPFLPRARRPHEHRRHPRNIPGRGGVL